MGRILLVVLVLLSAPAGAEGDRHQVFGPISGLQDLRGNSANGGILIRKRGHWSRLRLEASGPVFMAAAAPGPNIPAGVIPHSRPAAGKRDVRLAWLAGATERYGHGVLGDAIEAGELRVRTDTGRTLRHVLENRFVFEDLMPRLADVDGDGRDEILLVRSHRAHGAAAVLLGIRERKLGLIAESEPIGMANRWLNPVGVADFVGDGAMEVAVVETPHIGGKLVLYAVEGRRLREVARRPGYSTHVIGSTTLAMAAIADVNGDGVLDIMLPSQDRRALASVTFVGGKFRELSAIDAGQPIVSAVVTGDVDGRGDPDIVFWDAAARVHVILR